jgi:HEAT repeat protein
MILRLWAAALLVSCALALAGCAQNRGGLFASKPEPPPPGVVPPYERLEKLQELATQASQKTPVERESIAADLAAQIAREPDPNIREQIVRTLAAYPSTAAQNVLHAAMQDADLNVRVAACESWRQQDPSVAVRELTAALSEGNEHDVRMAAARELGRRKDRQALAPLAETLADPNPALQQRVASSLREISGRDFGPNVEAWRQYAATGQGEEPPVSLVERLGRLFR